MAIEDGVPGYLAEPGNIEQFVDHIQLMLDRDRWQNASGAAIERSCQCFSVEAMGAQYEIILNDLAQNGFSLTRAYNTTRELGSVPFYWWNYFPRVPAPEFFMNGVGALRKRWRTLRGRNLKPVSLISENEELCQCQIFSLSGPRSAVRMRFITY